MFTFTQRMRKKRLWMLLATLALVTLLLPFITRAAGNSVDPLTVIGQYIGNTILSIASWVTYFGGKLLGVSIEKLILNLGTLLGSGGSLGSMIGLLWGMIRDLCNLLFIFGFIYIGIRTIIDADDSNAKRMLASLIIGAILINFSLYFTKVVIDISNYTAVEIYHATFVGSGTISDKFGEILGIFDFMKGPKPEYLANTTMDGSFAFYFMAALLLMVAGFVFASGALLLVTRFIALVFIMIFSPFLFAATVFPQTAGYASQLWRLLFNYSFFAPAYLIMLLVSLKFIEAIMGMLNRTNSNVPKGLSEGKMDSFDVILAFIIGIMVMIYALKIAKQFGIAGSTQVMAIGSNLRGRGQRILGGATFGLAGAGARATFGRAGNYLAEKDSWKDAASRRGLKGVAARAALKTSRGAADASFDARNVAGMGSKLGIGDGRKGGYQTVKKEIEEKESKYAKSLGEVGDDDVQVAARKAEIEGKKKAHEKSKDKLADLNDLRRQALRNNDQNRVRELDAEITLQKEGVEKAEKEIKGAENAYEREKQRRIIGSTYTPDTEAIKTKKGEIKALKEVIKQRWEQYVSLDEADKPAQREVMKGFMEGLEKEEKALYSMQNELDDRGYAGKLEEPTQILNPLKWRFLTAWPTGRLVHHERAAGKEIRKAAEKGLPKKKDD